jgi:hypothetical protein
MASSIGPIRLAPSQREQAVAVLPRAFQDDPIARNMVSRLLLMKLFEGCLEKPQYFKVDFF